MNIGLALPAMGIALSGLWAWEFSSRSSLAVPPDSEVEAIYGGVCGYKVTVICGSPPIEPGCIATECFNVSEFGYRQIVSIYNCGIAECSTVGVMQLCAGAP